MMTRTRTLARGLAALGTIVLILVGIPAALWLFGGNPLPSSMPSLSDITGALSRPDDGTLFIGALTWVGWIAWASLAVSILVQALAEVRGAKAPRLPGMGWQQRRAAALTGAVAAMLTIAPAATMAGTATAAPAPTTTATTQSATVTTQAPTTMATPTKASTNASKAPSVAPVVVKPGDTLWQIADDELGDPTRYPEIAQRNKIDNPDLINVGQRLSIPQPSTSTTTTKDTAAAPASSVEKDTGDASQDKPAPPAASPAAPSSQDAPTATAPTDTGASAPFGGTGPTDASTASKAAPQAADRSGATSPPASPQTGPSTPAAAPAEAGDADGSVVPLVAGVGGLSLLAAAGAITLLSRRREQQSRRRQPGQRAATPPPASAAVETALTAGQSPLAVTDLDAALRTLSALTTLEDGPDTVPAVRAARITDDVIELYLVDDDATLPAPFTSAGDGAWLLQRQDRDQLLDHADALAYAPPCPALVSIGRDDEDGLLMLNLEQVGTLGISGTPQLTREIMTALAIELIGAEWADSTRVTLVGMLPELVDALESDRALYADTLDQVLGGMEYAAEVHRAALTSSDLDDIDQARSQGVHDEAWTPHLVLVDAELTDKQRERLDSLVQTLPRVAVAAITGTTQIGEWTLHTRQLPTGDVVSDLDPIGITVVPQRLSQDVYEATLDLYRSADAPDVPGPDWAQSITDGSAPDLDTIPIPEPTDDAHDVDDIDTDSAGDLDPGLVDQEQPTEDAPTLEDDALDNDETPVDDEAAETEVFETVSEADDTVDEDQELVDVDEADEEHADPVPATDEVLGEPTSDDVDEYPKAEAGEVGSDSAQVGERHLVAALDDPSQRPRTVTRRISAVPERDADAEPAADVTPLQLPDGPLLRLLGETVTLDNPGGKKPAAPGRSLEVLAYLALHPGRDETAFTEAIFPGKIYDKRIRQLRNNYMAAARAWVGTAEGDDHPFVALVDDGGYRLADDMPTDWGIFQRLVGDDISNASTEDLIKAMSLVTGAPMSRVTAGRYAWATSAMTEIRASVADVAHELSSRAARDGSPRTAMEAAMKGLWADPLMEVLWRDKITAAWATGQPNRALEVIAECQDTLDEYGDLSETTLDLIQQITDRTTRPHVA